MILPGSPERAHERARELLASIAWDYDRATSTREERPGDGELAAIRQWVENVHAAEIESLRWLLPVRVTPEDLAAWLADPARPRVPEKVPSPPPSFFDERGRLRIPIRISSDDQGAATP